MAITMLSAGSASLFCFLCVIFLTNIYRDGNRILTNDPAAPIPADQMTVQKCIDGCAAAGFFSAGLEYGRECRCGNISFPPGNVADINDCNMPCLGDASEYVSLFLVLNSSLFADPCCLGIAVDQVVCSFTTSPARQTVMALLLQAVGSQLREAAGVTM
jgi:hypothetical protein